MRRDVLAALLLSLATLALFWPATHNPFSGYDDPHYVSENPRVLTGLTAQNVAWAFTTGDTANYHPLTWLSLMLDTTLFGPTPRAYHRTNIALHAANAALLLLFLAAATSTFWRSAIVAALFAVHPLRVESVVWIAERKDVLSTFLILLALLAYLRYVRRGRWQGYTLMTLCFTLSLLAKPMYVTLPFLLLLLDYWPLRRFHPTLAHTSPVPPAAAPRHAVSLIVEKLPLLLLSIASSCITFVFQRAGGAVWTFDYLPLWWRLAHAVNGYAFYLGKLILPTDLAVIYPLHPPHWPHVFAAAALLVLISALVLWRRRDMPWLMVGWCWYLGLLVPVIGVVQVGIQAAADRYTYLPTVGVLIAVVWSVPETLARRPAVRWLAGAVVGVLIVGLSVATRQQIALWRDDVTLFHHTDRVTRQNPMAAFNLGAALARQGRFDAAERAMERAIAYEPNFAMAHKELGRARIAQGRLEESVEPMLRGVELAPTRRASYELGSVLLELDRPREARVHLERAVDFQADADALAKLATALGRTGEPEAALARARQGLAIEPDHVELLLAKGIALKRLERTDEAEAILRQLVARDPSLADVHNSLATLLASTGRQGEALRHFREAARLEPDRLIFRENLRRAEAQASPNAGSVPE